MSLPINLLTLDIETRGMPSIEAATNAALDTESLDYDDGGLPLWLQPADLSSSIARVTQLVSEILRDNTDPGGGNLRVSQVTREVLTGSSETIYLTALAIETLSRMPEVAAKGTSWMVWDTDNHLDIRMKAGILASAADDLAVLNGANMALWGQELIGFKTVQDLGAGLYRLSYLLRGRFGTEWAMRDHEVGDQFVLMDLNTIGRTTHDTAGIGAGKIYRAITIGQTIQQGVNRAFANTAVGLKPYAPCQVASSRDGGDNLTITWIRRTRYDGEWRDQVDVAIGEDAELYEVDILDATGTVVRTIEVTAQTAAYSAADQTTDFGAPQATLSVVIYQLSAIVGRGYGTARNV